MKTKKILVLIVAIVMIVAMVSVLAACGQNNSKESKLRVAMPDGTPLLAMASLMANKEKVGGYKLDFNVVPSNLIGSEITGEKADIAVMPTNAIVGLYKKGADYKIVTSNIFGVLYLIGNSDDAFTLDKLKGKVIYSIGEKNTPQLVFEKILKEKLGDDVVVNSDQAVSGKVAMYYVTDGQQVIAALKQGKANYGVVGEPAATNAKGKGFSVLYDLQKGWGEVTGGEESYPQASLVIKASLAKDKTFVKALVKALNGNLEYLANDENKAGLTELFKGYGSSVTFPAASVEKSNVGVKWAIDIKSEIESYLSVFGIKAPNSDFYFDYNN
ncbi:MAG: hypothetical protein SPG87_02845 [Eubacteriales bacterium]|nr:hypothetical protein [Eubacteriales bacterium]